MRSKTLAAILILALILPSVCVNVSAEGERATSLAAKISRDGGCVEIHCSLSDGDLARAEDKDLFLCRAPVYAQSSEEGGDAVRVDVIPQAEFDLQIPLPEDLTDAFFIAADNGDGTVTAVTGRAYITNPDALAQATYGQPAVHTKKGLDFTMFADAQLLGAAHTVIKVPINEFIVTAQENAVSVKRGSKVYNISREKLDKLDGQVKRYSEAGMRVYLDLLLTARKDGEPEYLYYEDAQDTADYYAVNVSNEESASALYAFVSYLTERYTLSRENGFCGNFIIGYEVNSNRKNNNAGQMSVYEYAEKYAAAVRIADTAARSVYSNAGIYVSLGNELNKGALGEGADPALDYSVTDLLSHFSACIAEGGDIPWKVSVGAHNMDGDTLFKDRPGSEYTYEADHLTMDNINIITSLLSRAAYLYNGERRGVIINGVGFGSFDNSDAELKEQAAAFCLAYYKAEANDQIEAFIYGSHIDTSDERENKGLYMRKNGTDGTPGEKKPIYNVFRYIDTDSSRIVSEPYLSICGISSWGEAVSGHNGASQTKRTVFSGIGTTAEDGLAGSKPVDLADITKFYPAENARFTEITEDGGKTVLKAELYKTEPVEYRGVSVSVDDISGFAQKNRIALDVKAEAPVNDAITDLMLRITGADAEGRETVYEGITQISSAAYHRIYFNISDYADKISGGPCRISVWVKPHAEENNGEYKLYIAGVSVLQKADKADMGQIIRAALIMLGAVALAVGGAYAVIYISKRFKYGKKKKENTKADDEAED